MIRTTPQSKHAEKKSKVDSFFFFFLIQKVLVHFIFYLYLSSNIAYHNHKNSISWFTLPLNHSKQSKAQPSWRKDTNFTKRNKKRKDKEKSYLCILHKDARKNSLRNFLCKISCVKLQAHNTKYILTRWNHEWQARRGRWKRKQEEESKENR